MVQLLEEVPQGQVEGLEPLPVASQGVPGKVVVQDLFKLGSRSKIMLCISPDAQYHTGGTINQAYSISKFQNNSSISEVK